MRNFVLPLNDFLSTADAGKIDYSFLRFRNNAYLCEVESTEGLTLKIEYNTKQTVQTT